MYILHPAAGASSPRPSAQLPGQIIPLWRLGGIPLVLIGLGGLNLLVPPSETYTHTERTLVTVLLFIASAAVWGTSLLVTVKKAQYENQCIARKEEHLIALARLLVDGRTPDEAKTLVSVLEKLITLVGPRQDYSRPEILPYAVYRQAELPDLLGLTQEFIKQAIQSGELPSKGSGNRQAVLGHFLLEWLRRPNPGFEKREPEKP
jgi:hypothetical protein